VPDPKGQTPERVIEIRDLICQKAGALAKELLGVTASRRAAASHSLLSSKTLKAL
jgi:hypothetical protein